MPVTNFIEIFMQHKKIVLNSPITCVLSFLGDIGNHWITCSFIGRCHWNLLWGGPRSAGTLKVRSPVVLWCACVGLGPWDFPWGVSRHLGWVAPPLQSNWWLEPPPGPPVPTGRASRRTGRYSLGLFQLHACLWPFSAPRGGGVPSIEVCISTAVSSFVIKLWCDAMGNTGGDRRSRAWDLVLCPGWIQEFELCFGYHIYHIYS